jgi:alkanesulfonate monooxygenase SsuD/methylene tetrahydromethanopterin reductase-like flavin-dependent oxidoreductase (luciferase family)
VVPRAGDLGTVPITLRESVVHVVKFGLFYILQQPPGKSAVQVYEDNLEQFRVADELGFDEIFLGEHRISEYGTLPNPMVLAAAAARVTKRIRIGTAVIIPAFTHPVRAAEEIAMVDVLSNGRFHLGVGRGYQSREFAAMGVDQNQSMGRFLEATVMIERLLTEENVTAEGQYWNLDDITVYPRPVQKRVPISVAVFKTQQTFDFAVERGYGILAGNPYSVQAEIEATYKEYMLARRRAGAAETTEQAWGLASTFVDTDQARAEQLLRQTSLSYMAQLGQHGSVIGKDGSIPKSYELHADTWWEKNVNHPLDVLDVPSTLVGHPDKVIAKLYRMYDEFGFQNVILSINMGGDIEQRDVLRTYELIADKVIPAVRHLGAEVPSSVSA